MVLGCATTQTAFRQQLQDAAKEPDAAIHGTYRRKVIKGDKETLTINYHGNVVRSRDGSLTVLLWEHAERRTAVTLEEPKRASGAEGSPVLHRVLQAAMHELRNTLHGLETAAEALRDADVSDKETQEDIHDLVFSARYTEVLINNILVIMQLRDGSIMPHNEPDRVRTMLVRLVRGLRSIANVPLELVISRDVPNSVILDSALVSRVLAMAIATAAKHCKKGSIVVTVSPIHSRGQDGALHRHGKLRYEVFDTSGATDGITVAELMRDLETEVGVAGEGGDNNGKAGGGAGSAGAGGGPLVGSTKGVRAQRLRLFVPTAKAIVEEVLSGKLGMHAVGGVLKVWFDIPFTVPEEGDAVDIDLLDDEDEQDHYEEQLPEGFLDGIAMSSNLLDDDAEESLSPEGRSGRGPGQSGAESASRHGLAVMIDEDEMEGEEGGGRYRPTAGALDDQSREPGTGAAASATAGSGGAGGFQRRRRRKKKRRDMSERARQGGEAVQGPLNMHVLLVDDQRVVRRNGEQMLKRLHCTSVCLEDGDEVELALADTSRPFDAILLDIHMLRTDGAEVCRNLRKDHNVSVPIIAMTAVLSMADVQRYYQMGFDVVLPKPFTTNQLARALLEGRQRRGPRSHFKRMAPRLDEPTAGDAPSSRASPLGEDEAWERANQTGSGTGGAAAAAMAAAPPNLDSIREDPTVRGRVRGPHERTAWHSNDPGSSSVQSAADTAGVQTELDPASGRESHPREMPPPGIIPQRPSQ